MAEPGGSAPEKRPQALGDGKKQRLLSPAEEERPRGVDGQVNKVKKKERTGGNMWVCDNGETR